MNDITDLLNLEDHNLQITNIRRAKGVKEITAETIPKKGNAPDKNQGGEKRLCSMHCLDIHIV